MTDTLYPDQVAAEAVARGTDPYFRGRIRDMANHASITNGTENGDSTRSYFVGLRVAKGWPLRGSITLYREDGARAYLRMTKTKFQVAVVKEEVPG